MQEVDRSIDEPCENTRNNHRHGDLHQDHTSLSNYAMLFIFVPMVDVRHVQMHDL